MCIKDRNINGSKKRRKHSIFIRWCQPNCISHNNKRIYAYSGSMALLKLWVCAIQHVSVQNVSNTMGIILLIRTLPFLKDDKGFFVYILCDI